MARRSLSLVAGGAVLFGALTASAQSLTPESRPERPYRGVFAGGTDDSEQVLSVSGAVGSGYDTSASLAVTESGLQPLQTLNPAKGSIYTNYSGGLSYTAQLEKLAFGASLSSSARQYPQLEDASLTTSHAASSGISLALGRNTRLRGGVAGGYQNMRGFTPFAELGDPTLGQVTPVSPDVSAPTLDAASSHVNYYTYSVNAGVTQQLSRRSSLTAGYDRQTSARSNGFEDLANQTASFRFTRSIGRYLALRLGYGYTEARYSSGGDRYVNHNIDTGVDYSRDLSLTRRTRLGFTSGATVVRQDRINRYDVVGSARLSRELGRTWSADLTYRRNVGFLDTVREPIFYDSLSSGIGGLITRRLSFRSGVGATRGSIGVTDRPANGFGAVTGSAGLNTAITRNLALGVNYTFYHYTFEDGAVLAASVYPRTNRHSVSVMLSAWAPIFQHGKRSNASR